MHGFFVAVEGVEGSGKTTQAALLAEALRETGRCVHLLREPGSTALGERIRRTVLADRELAVPPASELFLMLAARAALVKQRIGPALEVGETVISDRYELSTFAYQGAGRGLSLEEVRRVNRLATGGLSPHVTLLLDLATEDGVRRQRREGKPPDRLESESTAFHLRVAAEYRRLAREDPTIRLIDARGTPNEVRGRVLAAVRSVQHETFFAAGVNDSASTQDVRDVPLRSHTREVPEAR